MIKNKKVLNKIRRILCAGLLLFFLSACYESVEGCLDIAATNFDADADDPCPDCCTFPALSIDFRHRVVTADTFFNLVYVDSVYTDDFGNPYRISNIQFYLSNFRLLRADGTELGVTDSLQFEIEQSTGETIQGIVEDNFALVNRNTFSDYDLGTFPESGTFTGMRFAIGVEGEANTADPNSVPASHPLAVQEEDMYFNVDSGYVFNKIEFFRDTIASDTIPTILDIGLEQNLQRTVLFADFTLIEGFNTVVTLQIDYASWFSGIDMKNDSETNIAEKIVENITQSFSLLTIVQQN